MLIYSKGIQGFVLLFCSSSARAVHSFALNRNACTQRNRRMMSSSSTVSSPEPNNNHSPNSPLNNSGRLIKANSFSFRRRYFLKPSDNVPVNEDQRQSSFIQPQSPPRTSLSLRSFRSSLDSYTGRRTVLDKNSNHSFPASPTKTPPISPLPPVSPHHHRTSLFRNSMPKTGVSTRPSPTGVQQLSTSWEFIRWVRRMEKRGKFTRGGKKMKIDCLTFQWLSIVFWLRVLWSINLYRIEEVVHNFVPIKLLTTRAPMVFTQCWLTGYGDCTHS